MGQIPRSTERISSFYRSAPLLRFEVTSVTLTCCQQLYYEQSSTNLQNMSNSKQVGPSYLDIYAQTQPSIPSGSVNEYQLRLGRQRQEVWFIPLADERGVCR